MDIIYKKRVSPRFNRLWLGCVLAALLLLIFCASAFDRSLQAAVFAWGQGAVGQAWAGGGYWLGQGWVLIGAFVLLGAWGYFSHRQAWFRLGALGTAATVGAGLGAQLVKHLVGRPRPRMDLDPAQLMGPTLDSDFHSFPSGHTATAFAAAAILAARWPRLAWLFYGLALAVGLGRIVGGSHYPGDVIGGALLGLMVGLPLAARLRAGDGLQ